MTEPRRIYTTRDPRANLMREICHQLLKHTGPLPPGASPPSSSSVPACVVGG